MDDEEIAVNWRAAIFSSEGAPPIYGRVSKIGKGGAVVKVDHNLLPGHQCSLAVQLPKSKPDEAMQLVEGYGVVLVSVLSSAQFHVTLQSLQIKGNGKALLDEQIRKYKETRKGS